MMMKMMKNSMVIDQKPIDKEVQSSERGCVVENNNINHDTRHPPKH